MSAKNYAQMSTDELIRGFIQKTQFVGGGWPSPWNLPEQARAREATRQEIYAIRAELITRNSIAQVRPLFDHESRDVRSWAAGQLSCTSPGDIEHLGRRPKRQPSRRKRAISRRQRTIRRSDWASA